MITNLSVTSTSDLSSLRYVKLALYSEIIQQCMDSKQENDTPVTASNTEPYHTPTRRAPRTERPGEVKALLVSDDSGRNVFSKATSPVSTAAPFQAISASKSSKTDDPFPSPVRSPRSWHNGEPQAAAVRTCEWTRCCSSAVGLSNLGLSALTQERETG